MSTPRTVPRTHPLLKSRPEEAMRKSFERLPIFKIGATAFEQSSRMNGSPDPGMKLDFEDDRVQHSIKETSIVTDVHPRETMRKRRRGSTLKRQPKHFRFFLGECTLLEDARNFLSFEIASNDPNVQPQHPKRIQRREGC